MDGLGGRPDLVLAKGVMEMLEVHISETISNMLFFYQKQNINNLTLIKVTCP